ncbi:conjugative transposon protein TraK [Dyadobacter psychrophilus]|uniref:Bacteroides conjugative transposon TraK protein n=1 Tax=Dyadobacter psychrophilus TaxID=651661 RepID=A0A1T5HDC7_9BACT|nr:conjugative transposon protein TraK [Dyadobacter psychrophilus]SKC18662.1 Bacteroides conjugative transposon TraK protein [Dyadobacter psychrophilus]
MFTKAKNIDTAFRHVRSLTLVVIIASATLCCFALFKSYEMVQAAHSKVYILANGKVLDAYASERKENIPVEARDHVATFHRFFFSLDPDDKVIQSNVVKALYLADASAKAQYENLKESGFYTSIISGNISQQIQIDSVQINTDAYPYYFNCTASQRIIRATSIVTRRLITEGYLRSVTRSDNNPHGFLIERWTTLENKDVNIQNR